MNKKQQGPELLKAPVIYGVRERIRTAGLPLRRSEPEPENVERAGFLRISLFYFIHFFIHWAVMIRIDYRLTASVAEQPLHTYYFNFHHLNIAK